MQTKRIKKKHRIRLWIKGDTIKYDTITKEAIDKLVNSFYPKILQNEVTAPFFVAKLGDDINSRVWQDHLELISSFWESIALGEGDYRGNPLAAHFNVEGISVESFREWLRLFGESLDEIFEEEQADFFKQRSLQIANNFIANLGLA